MKHTHHSRQRIHERAGGHTKEIRDKLAHGQFIALPRLSSNKRVSLIKLRNADPVVVIWSENANVIITVLTLRQYIKRFGLPEHQKKLFELL